MKRHRPLHIHPDNSVLFLTARIYGGFSYLALKETKMYLFKKASSVLGKYKLGLDAWVVLDNHYHFLLRVNEGQFFANFVRELHGATAHFIKKGFAPLVTDFGQRLVKEVTPWDKRQIRVLGVERRQLERELKFANTEKERADVIAQFIARYQKRFKVEVYRGLKFAITKSRLTDPEIILSLLAKDAPVWYQYVDRVVRNEEDYYRHLNYIHQNPVKHNYVKKMSDYEFSSIGQFIKEKGKEWVTDCFRNYPIIDFESEGIID